MIPGTNNNGMLMVDTLEPKPGTSYWIIGGAALLWNLFGLMVYVMQVSATPEELASALSAEQIALIEATPLWVTSMTAIATNAGVVASVLLLLRLKWSVPAFAISLAAIVAQDVYIFGMSSSVEAFGNQVVVIQGMVLVLAVLFLWYARRAKGKGLLR